MNGTGSAVASVSRGGSADRVSFWAALLSALAAAVSFGVAATTPPDGALRRAGHRAGVSVLRGRPVRTARLRVDVPCGADDAGVCGVGRMRA